MTGFLHEREFSRKTFIKGGGAVVVGLSAAGAGLGAKTASAEPSTEKPTIRAPPPLRNVLRENSCS